VVDDIWLLKTGTLPLNNAGGGPFSQVIANLTPNMTAGPEQYHINQGVF